MKQFSIALAIACCGWVPQAFAQGTTPFPASIAAKSAASSPLTNQCIPIVNNAGTTTTKLCSGYAAAFSAAASNATLTLGSTTLTLGGTTTSVSGLTLPSPTFSGTVVGAATIPNSVLVNSSLTIAGHSVSLGGSQALACADLSNAATGCSTATGTSGATTPLLNANNTWSAAQAVSPVALTDGATVSVNAALSNTFTLTLTGNTHTLANPTNVIAGQTFQFAISTGSGFSGFATGSNYKYAGGTAPTWSSAASKKDVLSCWADTTSTLNCAALIDVR